MSNAESQDEKPISPKQGQLSSEPIYLAEMPYDVFPLIFSNFENDRDLKSVRRVSRMFKEAADEVFKDREQHPPRIWPRTSYDCYDDVEHSDRACCLCLEGEQQDGSLSLKCNIM